MSSFLDLVSQTKILEGNLVRQIDIDVNFISSNGKDLRYPQMHDKSLVRYQVMELFVRIAIDKYYK
jgi:hypothetical protein